MTVTSLVAVVAQCKIIKIASVFLKEEGICFKNGTLCI